MSERVEYLRLLIDEFNRRWPYGAVRSSEYSEREAFDDARMRITKLRRQIERDIEGSE